MLEISLRGWKLFEAAKDKVVLRRWLSRVAKTSERTFEQQMQRGAKSGRVAYRKGGGRFVRSAPGEYPARDSGKLIASLRSRSSLDEAVVGTNMFYSKFLREGTKKMARRRMSDNALREGATAELYASRGWLKWKKSR